MTERSRKPFWERSLKNNTVSRRKAAGTRRNQKHKFVGSFTSDKKEK